MQTTRVKTKIGNSVKSLPKRKPKNIFELTKSLPKSNPYCIVLNESSTLKYAQTLFKFIEKSPYKKELDNLSYNVNDSNIYHLINDLERIIQQIMEFEIIYVYDQDKFLKVLFFQDFELTEMEVFVIDCSFIDKLQKEELKIGYAHFLIKYSNLYYQDFFNQNWALQKEYKNIQFNQESDEDDFIECFENIYKFEFANFILSNLIDFKSNSSKIRIKKKDKLLKEIESIMESLSDIQEKIFYYSIQDYSNFELYEPEEHEIKFYDCIKFLNENIEDFCSPFLPILYKDSMNHHPMGIFEITHNYDYEVCDNYINNTLQTFGEYGATPFNIFYECTPNSIKKMWTSEQMDILTKTISYLHYLCSIDKLEQ